MRTDNLLWEHNMSLADTLIEISIESILDKDSIAEYKKLHTMRKLRNACASYMTNVSTEITIEEQDKWWGNLDRAIYNCYLLKVLRMDSNDWSYIGYGLIKNKDNKSWLTGGIAPDYRNLRLGRILFASLMTLSKYEPWLEVLISNVRAYKLYKSLGFIELDRDSRIAIMKYGG